MAQKVLITMTCDLPDHPVKADPEADVETITFGLDGREYEIDACGADGPPLREFLARYIQHARTAPRQRSQPGRAGRAPGNKERIAEIRAWAKTRGLKINDRGRVPVVIEQEFDAAHGR